MSLKKIALSGIFWTFSQQFGAQLITFIVSIIMARILMPEEYGLIGMIAVFVALGHTLIDSGLTQSLIRMEKPDQVDFSTVFFFNLGGSVLIYLLLFFAAPFIASFYNQLILCDLIRLYCFSFVIRAFSAVQLTRLTKIMDFKSQLIIALPSLIVSGFVGIILAYNDYGVWSLAWMQIVQSSLNTVQLWWRSKWVPSLVFSRERFKIHFNFGYKLALAGILNTFFDNIYQIVIGKFFLASQVGFYTRANSLKQLPVTNLSAALNKVTYPLFASIQHDNERLRSAYKQIMEMVIFVIAPVLIFLGVLAEPLFRFLFTEKWLPAVPYFQILCLTGILHPIHSYNLNVLKVKGRTDLFLILEGIKKIIVIITILVSIRFGIIGLIWGQLITSILSFFVNSHYTGKFLKYSSLEQLRDISPIILLAIFVGSILIFIDRLLYIESFIDISRILVGGLSGSIIYISIAYLLKMSSLKSLQKIILKR